MSDPKLTLADDFAPVSYDDWRAVVEKDLKGAPFEKRLVTRTYEGIDLMPVYTSDDAIGPDASGLPGQSPLTRGSTPLGASMCGWDICQQLADPDIESANKALLADLQRGVTSVWLQMDKSVRHGLDADDVNAEHIVGRSGGCMVYNRDDLDALLKDVQPQMVGFSLDAGAGSLAMAGCLIAVLQQRGIDLKQMRGTFGCDPLGTLVGEGALRGPYEDSLRHMADLAAYASKHVPGMSAACVDTSVYHAAGATETQDLAYALATGVAYLRAIDEGKLEVAEAAKQISFRVSVGCDFFMAIAKLRAVRKLWARVIEASGGDPAACAIKLHATTADRVVTKRDPWVNMLRNTVCCFAGAVGGAQTITTLPFDAAIGEPDGFSRRIARNTQVILNEEANLFRVIDPAGGCWFIEKLTDQLAEQAWPIFQQIEKQGGMAEAVLGGTIAGQVSDALAARMKNIATRRDPITGVSEYPNINEKPIEKQPRSPEDLRAKASDRMAKAHAKSDADPTTLSLVEAGEGKLTEAVLDAIKKGASVGQITKSLAASKEPMRMTPLRPHPYAEPFEQLRDASDAYLAKQGHRPKVFLANLGPVAVHTVRASWSTNFFEAGGFEIVTNKGFDDADSAAKAFAESDTNIACICSSDDVYAEKLSDVAPALKEAGARNIVLAGFPGKSEDTYKQAGVDCFIYLKCDVLGILRDLLTQEGVIDAK